MSLSRFDDKKASMQFCCSIVAASAHLQAKCVSVICSYQPFPSIRMNHAATQWFSFKENDERWSDLI